MFPEIMTTRESSSSRNVASEQNQQRQIMSSTMRALHSFDHACRRRRPSLKHCILWLLHVSYCGVLTHFPSWDSSYRVPILCYRPCCMHLSNNGRVFTPYAPRHSHEKEHSNIVINEMELPHTGRISMNGSPRKPVCFSSACKHDGQESRQGTT
jgi:hypothetical protein